MSSDSNSFFTHVLGDNSVQLVEVTNKLKVSAVYEAFLDHATSNCIALGIVYMPMRDKLVALVETNGRISLVSKTSSKGLKLSFELPPQCGHQGRSFYPTSLARSSKEGYVLLGGSDSKDPRMGTAVVTIYRLEDNLVSVDCLSLQEGNMRTMVASCITKLPERDVFVVGTYASIFVIEWNSIQLAVLANFQNQHSCTFNLFRDRIEHRCIEGYFLFGLWS